MSGELNFGASVPQEAITQAQREILLYQQVNKDGYFSRILLQTRTTTNPNIRKDIVRRVDATAAKDGISTAKITAGGAVPDIVGTKKKEDVHQIYFISDAVLMNEALLEVDPSAWNSDVRVAMMECQRRENHSVINGVPALNQVGIVGSARANPRGKIVAAGASGKDDNNAGAWNGSETDHVMNPYEDLRKAVVKINPSFPSSSLYLGGRPESLSLLLQEDDLGKRYVDKIGPLFGRVDRSLDFMVACDYFPADAVYVISKNMNAAELVIAEDYNIDANYPRQPGKNRYAEIGGWIGIEFHNNQGFVEVAIN
jgi:hypothetical protein